MIVLKVIHFVHKVSLCVSTPAVHRRLVTLNMGSNKEKKVLSIEGKVKLYIK